MSENSCSTCRYWKPGVGIGACHKNPPTLQASEAYAQQFLFGAWPPCQGDDFCGEWYPVEVRNGNNDIINAWHNGLSSKVFDDRSTEFCGDCCEHL